MKRVVFVNQSVRVEPINIVEGDTLTAIDIYFADLTLDSSHSVKARNLRPDNTTKLITSWSIPSANLYNYVEDGVLHQRVGRVDLGALNYTYDEPYARFYSDVIDSLPNVGPNNLPNALLTDDYSLIEWYKFYFQPSDSKYVDKVFCISESKRVQFHDLSFTNADEFKNHLNNAYLYYELNEEITKAVGDEVKTFRSTSKNTTNNYIRLYASADTFAEGKNKIQIKLYTTGNSKRTYTFIVPVVCHKNICGGD